MTQLTNLYCYNNNNSNNKTTERKKGPHFNMAILKPIVINVLQWESLMTSLYMSVIVFCIRRQRSGLFPLDRFKLSIT